MRETLSLRKYQTTILGPMLKEALETQGKGFRSVIAFEIARALNPIIKIPESILARLELMHYSTLIHDDIIDGSYLRRGQPSLWRKFSPETAMLLGNFIHGSIYDFSDIADAIESQRLVQLSIFFSQAYLKAHAGEILETINRNNEELPILTCLRIAKGKTSSLIELAARVGWLFSSTDEIIFRRLGAFATAFGLSYQIYNDILDFFDKTGGKSTFEDVRLGIPTLPILLFYRHRTETGRPHVALESLGHDRQRLDQFVEDLYRSGVLTTAAEVCRSFALRAEKYLEAALGCTPPEGIGEILTRFKTVSDSLPPSKEITWAVTKKIESVIRSCV